jgi:hypothetical protein
VATCLSFRCLLLLGHLKETIELVDLAADAFLKDEL